MTTSTPTVSAPSARPFLGEGWAVEYAGKKYLITKVNDVNYQVVDKQGKKYNLRRNLPVTDLGFDREWSTEVRTAEIAAVVFKDGDPVVLAGGGRYGGKKGLVCKVTPTKYHVVVRGLGVITAPFASVSADES
jgi:hypothetical protein